MRRFAGEAPTRLDAIPCDAFAELRKEREAEDARILSFVEGLSEADLAGRFRCRTITQPTDPDQPLAPALLHFFDHQTRHRPRST